MIIFFQINQSVSIPYYFAINHKLTVDQPLIGISSGPSDMRRHPYGRERQVGDVCYPQASKRYHQLLSYQKQSLFMLISCATRLSA